jgi:hypothetical protein
MKNFYMFNNGFFNVLNKNNIKWGDNINPDKHKFFVDGYNISMRFLEIYSEKFAERFLKNYAKR